MRLAQAFDTTNWSTISAVLCRCYPDSREYHASFGAAYAHIRTLPPVVATKMQIHIAAHSDNCDQAPVEIGVFGRDGSFFEHHDLLPRETRIEARFNLSYTAWEEWLGMEIAEAAVGSFAPEEIVAHCLWEMTCVGFSQELIRQRLAHLREQVES